MVELADTLDLGSSAREGVRVRLSVGALGMRRASYCFFACVCLTSLPNGCLWATLGVGLSFIENLERGWCHKY